MKLPLGPMDARRLASLSPEELHDFLSKCRPRELLLLDAQFEMWAAEGQIEPDETGWRVWLMMAGRGFGKTRAGAEWIHQIAMTGRKRIALVAATIDEARAIMVEGVSGLLSVARRQRVRVKWEPSLGRLKWPKGSVANLFSGDNPDSLRGPEHHFAWVLTFEVEADAEPVALSQLLADASDGAIEASDHRPIGGFAAYGGSAAESIAPLVELCGLQLAEQTGKLRSPSSTTVLQLTEKELGCDPEGSRREMVEYVRSHDSERPASMLLTYHDPARDYLVGQMRASSGGGGRIEQRVELPAVIPADQAKQWVEEAMARRWQDSHAVRLRLPPSQMGLIPGQAIQLPGSTNALSVRSVTTEGMAVGVEAGAAPAGVSPLPADPGRPVTDPDLAIGRTELALFELPPMGDSPESAAKILAAASNEGRWKRLPVELWLGQGSLPAVSLSRRAILGTTTSKLADRMPAILDEISSVIVRMANPDQFLLNCDLDGLMAGANLAIAGDEMFQFGRAEQLAPGLFRLSRLLRGRRGTEWAAATHAIGEKFCLLDGHAGLAIDLPATAVGGELVAIAHGLGDSAPLPEFRRLLGGNAMRPPPACHLDVRRDGSDLRATWVRRSFRNWAWTDGIGDGLDPFPERYRLVVTGPLGELIAETEQPAVLLPISSLPGTGGDMVRLSIHTIGPVGISHARIANFII